MKRKNNIRTLIKQLYSLKIEKQEKAARKLGEMRSRKAVKPLVYFLNYCTGLYEKRFLTSAIVKALGKIGSRSAEKALIKVLKGHLLFTKTSRVKIIGNVEYDASKNKEETAVKEDTRTQYVKAATPLMFFCYKEADEQLKKDVITALSTMASNGSIDFLERALKSENPEIRSCAALALGEARCTIAESSLKNLLTDPVIKVRKNAAQALGLIKFLPK